MCCISGLEGGLGAKPVSGDPEIARQFLELFGRFTWLKWPSKWGVYEPELPFGLTAFLTDRWCVVGGTLRKLCYENDLTVPQQNR